MRVLLTNEEIAKAIVKGSQGNKIPIDPCYIKDIAKEITLEQLQIAKDQLRNVVEEVDRLSSNVPEDSTEELVLIALSDWQDIRKEAGL